MTKTLVQLTVSRASLAKKCLFIVLVLAAYITVCHAVSIDVEENGIEMQVFVSNPSNGNDGVQRHKKKRNARRKTVTRKTSKEKNISTFLTPKLIFIGLIIVIAFFGVFGVLLLRARSAIKNEDVTESFDFQNTNKWLRSQISRHSHEYPGVKSNFIHDKGVSFLYTVNDVPKIAYCQPSTYRPEVDYSKAELKTQLGRAISSKKLDSGQSDLKYVSCNTNHKKMLYINKDDEVILANENVKKTNRQQGLTLMLTKYLNFVKVGCTKNEYEISRYNKTYILQEPIKCEPEETDSVKCTPRGIQIIQCDIEHNKKMNGSILSTTSIRLGNTFRIMHPNADPNLLGLQLFYSGNQSGGVIFNTPEGISLMVNRAEDKLPFCPPSTQPTTLNTNDKVCIISNVTSVTNDNNSNLLQVHGDFGYVPIAGPLYIYTAIGIKSITSESGTIVITKIKAESKLRVDCNPEINDQIQLENYNLQLTLCGDFDQRNATISNSGKRVSYTKENSAYLKLGLSKGNRTDTGGEV